MTFSGAGNWLSITPRRFPYENTDPLRNSAAVNLLGWITDNFSQGEFKVCKEVKVKGKTEKKPLDNHPLQQLMERPNPYYGGATLWAGVLFSYHTDGNAYILKVRNARGLGYPTELWYEPHWSIKPHWPSDGSKFIDYYERTVNGRTQTIPVENVIHLRNGLNPANSRYGWARLKASSLQVYSDIEYDYWVAALARNMAIPGVVISPEENIGMTDTKADKIIQTFERKFGGDNKGRTMVLDFKAAIQTLGFDPKTMQFRENHDHAESRIAGALRVPPGLVYLNVANKASTYDNLKAWERQGWQGCIIPSYEQIEDQLDAQLLIDFEIDPMARGIYCEFDKSNIEAIKDDQDAKEKRAKDAFSAGGLTWNEYRAELGKEPVEGEGDWIWLPSNGRPATPEQVAARAAQEIEDPVSTAPEDQGNTGKPQAASAGKGLPVFSILSQCVDAQGGVWTLYKDGRKVYEYDGLSLGREPSDLEKSIDLKSLVQTMDAGKQSVASQLSNVRNRLIDELALELDELDPEDYDQATAGIADNDKTALLATLLALFGKGAKLVLDELRRIGFEVEAGKANPDETFLSTVTKATLTKLSTDVRARAIASASQARLLDVPVLDRIRSDFDRGSTAYLDRSASEASNVAIAEGRMDELKAQGIEQILYSAVLDLNTCGPCGKADGLVGSFDEVPAVPNGDCEGGAQCRCIWIATRGL